LRRRIGHETNASETEQQHRPRGWLRDGGCLRGGGGGINRDNVEDEVHIIAARGLERQISIGQIWIGDKGNFLSEIAESHMDGVGVSKRLPPSRKLCV
jgi:hypothetical protein